MTEPVWQEWRAFPDPTKGEFLTAPFGAGVYWLRDSTNGENIYIGEGSHVAQRMTSLLPAPLGHGTRNNTPLREYVLADLAHIEYRTTACPSKADALGLEALLIAENTPRF